MGGSTGKSTRDKEREKERRPVASGEGREGSRKERQ